MSCTFVIHSTDGWPLIIFGKLRVGCDLNHCSPVTTSRHLSDFRQRSDQDSE